MIRMEIIKQMASTMNSMKKSMILKEISNMDTTGILNLLKGEIEITMVKLLLKMVSIYKDLSQFLLMGTLKGKDMIISKGRRKE